MRIRHKPYARPALEACPFFVARPESLKGRWQQPFDRPRPLHLELGCGKGEFIAQMITQSPEVNYIAVDLKDEILYLAMEAVDRARGDAPSPDNLRLTAFDIERIEAVLGPEDAVSRIYINFPNPWPKDRHHKHRLIHGRQIAHYLTFLAPEGEIYFRTDHPQLFEDGMASLSAAGFALNFATRDLLNSPRAAYPDSEHQRMFVDRGMPIYFCIARRT